MTSFSFLSSFLPGHEQGLLPGWGRMPVEKLPIRSPQHQNMIDKGCILQLIDCNTSSSSVFERQYIIRSGDDATNAARSVGIVHRFPQKYLVYLVHMRDAACHSLF